MTGSVGDAEDIVQDAFLGMTRARQAGTTIADPKAYLATAVTRLGISYLSSARGRRGRSRGGGPAAAGRRPPTAGAAGPARPGAPPAPAVPPAAPRRARAAR